MFKYSVSLMTGCCNSMGHSVGRKISTQKINHVLHKMSICLSFLIFTSSPVFALNFRGEPGHISTIIAQNTANQGKKLEIEPDVRQGIENFAKQITVQITTDNNKGSGTLIGKQGNSYLVLTNAHVVSYGKTFTILTHDGKQHKATIVGNPLPDGYDLALLKFTSEQEYTIVQKDEMVVARKENGVFAAGYVAETGEFTVTEGTVIQMPEKQFKEGYNIGYSNDIQQGMSGGPIITEQGLLVGINGISAAPIINHAYTYQDGKPPTPEEIQQFRQVSWGIPINTLLTYIQPEIVTWELALTDYTKAIELNPNYAQAYLNRGNLYKNQQKWELALADYNKAIELNPNLADAYNNRGNLYSDLQKWELALPDYTKAIELNPNLADAYNNRGNLYSDLQKWELALPDYTKAIELNQNAWFAMTNIGLIKYEQGAVNEAIQQFQQAISINNEAAEPQLALAVALYGKGETERALKLAENALKIDAQIANIDYLKNNLWGDKLMADTQKLLAHPELQSYVNQ